MSTKRAIIADDALDFGRMLQATLMTMDGGIQTIVVPSAEEAMLEAARGFTDLMVADLHLPGMSGLDLVRKMRLRHPKMKIIVATGMREAGLQERCIQQGADRFFLKPLSIQEFISAVQQLFSIEPQEQLHPPAVETKAALVLPPPGRPGLTPHASEIITDLRKRLGAQVVLLADESGKTAAQAGEFGDPTVETHLLPVWLEGIRSTEKAAQPWGGVGRAAVFQWKDLDLVLSPVGGMALLIATQRGRSSIRLALALEEALTVQQELMSIFEHKVAAAEQSQSSVTYPLEEAVPDPVQATAQIEAPEPPAESAEGLGDLEDLFGQPVQRLNHEELNSFWDEVNTVSANIQMNPNALDYEQALKMGLGPRGMD
jgi:CheY-like chemotaxis protein